MYTEEDIYVMFRKAQSKYLSRPYRLPKDFNTFMQNRMSEINRESLTTITNWFNTKWRNINPEGYFSCGFSIIGKSFTYHKFFNTRIHNLYVTRDKIKKRDTDINKIIIEKSLAFVFNYTNKHSNVRFSVYSHYCSLLDDGIKAPVKHYLDGHIDRLVLTWLIYRKYLILSDEDKMLMPAIIDNYIENVELAKEFIIIED